MSKIHLTSSSFNEEELYASRPEKMRKKNGNDDHSQIKKQKPKGRFITKEGLKAHFN